MGIFSRTHVAESTAEVSGVEATVEGMFSIAVESAAEEYKIIGALYVVDSMIDRAVATEGASEEALLEGAIGDFWKKVKAMFQSLKEKILTWFEKVKRQFALWFKTGKAFAEKFEKEIKDKNPKDFKFKGYKYTVDAGAAKAEAFIKVIDSELDTHTSALQVNNFDHKAWANGVGEKDEKAEYDVEAAEEKMLGGNTLQEIIAEIKEAYHNGETAPEEFEGFAGTNSKEEMVKFIINANKVIADMENAQKKVAATFGKILSALDKAETAASKADNAGMTSYCSHVIKCVRFGATTIGKLHAVKIDCVQEAAHSFERTLKSFLSFRPAKVKGTKEGFEGDDDMSLLESAMKLL